MGRRSGMLLAMCVAGWLGACGGGGGGGAAAGSGGGGGGGTVAPTPVPTVATGWWTGSTEDHRTLTALVLADGSFSILYSSQDAPDTVAGLVQGTGAGVDGAFGSTNALDFSLADGLVTSTEFSAAVVARQSFNGDLSADAPDFTTRYNPAFERRASLDDVAGSYQAQAARPTDAMALSLSIDAQGVLAGSGTGCNLNGMLVARSDANAFDAVLAFSGDDCASNGASFNGVALFDADTRVLYLMAPNPARTDALLVRATPN